MSTVSFFFDPSCPWTWRTSRWLVDVADQIELAVQWQPMSLAVLNDGEIPAKHQVALEASGRALRLVAALGASGRWPEIGRFYTELGARTHAAGEPFTAEAVAGAAHGVGLADDTVALDDAGLDAPVRQATEAAVAAAGPDVGSPVLALAGLARGLHGPILTADVTGKDAVALWEAVELQLGMEAFSEVKRGRG